MEKTKDRPTEKEARILLEAQRDYIKEGNTAIRCPRCGGGLEHRRSGSGESIQCMVDGCIVVYTRGI